MKKAKFVMNALRELQAKAEEFKAKGITNGNAVNKVVKDIERKSYESGLFGTGVMSSTTVNKDGSPYELQDSPNWRVIFNNYLNF